MDDLETIVRQIAERASAHSGVNADEIARELELDRKPGHEWDIQFRGASSIVREAVQQAMDEVLRNRRNAP